MSAGVPENSDVYMDIAIDETPIGRIVLKLYDDVTPKTA